MLKRYKNPRRIIVTLLGIALLLTLVGVALANGDVLLTRELLSSGGGEVSNSEVSMRSSIGQPVAGSVTSGDLTGCFGFNCGEGITAPTPTATSPSPGPTPTSTPGGPSSSDKIFLPLTLNGG